jgi:hypothetical protein
MATVVIDSQILEPRSRGIKRSQGQAQLEEAGRRRLEPLLQPLFCRELCCVKRHVDRDERAKRDRPGGASGYGVLPTIPPFPLRWKEGWREGHQCVELTTGSRVTPQAC